MKKQYTHNLLCFINIRFIVFFLIILITKLGIAQMPSCPNGLIYSQTGTTIENYNPSLPTSAVNPMNNSIVLPSGAAGLAVCNNLSGTGPSPTFYTIVNNLYYYWNGSSWVNTGHSTGNVSAVNIGGGGNYLYNLVGSTGQIYRYDGCGNGTLITTINNFDGPYDVVCDNNGNFYLLKTTNPQSLRIYSPTGTLVTSYNLVGLPVASSGGGFAIIGNQIYLHNGSFYKGTISGTSVTFTASSSPVSPSDFACCPLNYTPILSPSISNTGPLSCGVNTVNLIANSTSPTYTWSGPGLVGSNSSSVAIASAPGVYSCAIVGSCTNTTTYLTTTVTTTSLLSPTITTLGNLTCSSQTMELVASPGPTNHTYTWSGSGIISGINTNSVVINSAGIYTVDVTHTVTGCSGVKTISVTSTNTINLSVTNATICLGSSATLTVNGANSYSWNPSPSLSSTSGSIVVASPTINSSYIVTGSQGLCSASSVANVTVIPLPIVSVTPTNATICVGLAGTTFTASGANSYSWQPTGSLSSSTGSVVTANPISLTIYSVTGTLNSCSNTTTFTVDVSPTLFITITPNNSNICSGNSINIAASGAPSYTWSNSSGLSATSGSTVSASPNATTVYTVIGDGSVCSGSQTFTVNVTPTPTVSISADTTIICEGGNTQLYAKGAEYYSWSPTSSLSSPIDSITIASPTITTLYTLVGTNGIINACTNTKTITVNVIPKIVSVVSPSVEICLNSSTTLYTSGGNTIAWQPKNGLNDSVAFSPIVSPSVTTTYTTYISNNGVCPDIKTILVYVNPLPTVMAGNDTILNFGDSYVLAGSGQGNLAWISGEYMNCNHCSSIKIFPQNNSCYVLEAIDDKGCRNTDDICITINKEFAYFIPNSFTPNNNDLNEEFKIIGYGIKEDVLIEIYNRWGNLIFSSNNINVGWDGKQNGVICPSGIYIYKATINTIQETTEIKYGHISLLGKL